MDESEDDEPYYVLNLFAMQMQKYQYRRLYPPELWLIWSMLDLKCYDVNARDDRGIPPIVYAAKRGSVILVRLLLRYNADINAPTRELETALVAACRTKKMRTIRLLLRRGARTDLIDKLGWSALRWAVQHQHEGMLRLLLRHNSSVMRDAYTHGSALERALEGSTPTHAAMLGDLQARLVLERQELLKELQTKRQQEEIQEIAAFRRNSSTIPTPLPMTTHVELKETRKQRAKTQARASRRTKIVPINSPVPSADPVTKTLSTTILLVEHLQAHESEHGRWVRISKGQWRRQRLQDTVSSDQPQNAAEPTEANVEPFEAVQAHELITSEAKWQSYMHRRVKENPADLTIEELA